MSFPLVNWFNYSIPWAQPAITDSAITEKEHIVGFLCNCGALNLIEKIQFPLTKESSIALIKHFISKIPRNLCCKYLGCLKIKDNAFLFEIVKTLANQWGSEVSEYIHEYGISDPEQLFEIAMISTRGANLCSFIQNYGISNKDKLFQIAMNVTDSIDLSVNIKKFGFTDQETLFFIAGRAIKRDYRCAEFIQNFGIEDPQKRYFLAIDSGRMASPHIRNFNITDQEHLFEIAKNSAEYDGQFTSLYIKNYGIIDQEKRFEIAKIVAKNGLGKPLNYDLSNDQLFKLAKIAAKNAHFSNYIEKYEITDQDQLFEIAMNAAECAGNNVAECIENYKLKSESQLFFIAKACAKSSSEKTAQFIQLFRIENEIKRFEIAKIIAPYDLCIHFKKFNFTNETLRFDLAKLLAAKANISTFISNFEITDKKKLLEIAKIAIETDASDFCNGLSWYGFTDQNDLFELAKTVAKNNLIISANIKLFNIQDPNKRLEIAKIAAEKDGRTVSDFIENYNLPNSYEVAKIAIKQNPWCAKNIHKYKIKDTKLLKELAFDTLFMIAECCNQYTYTGTTPESLFSYIDTLFKNVVMHFPLEKENNSELIKLIQPDKLKEKAKAWANINLSGKSYTLQQVFLLICRLDQDQTFLISFLRSHPLLLPAIFSERDVTICWPLLSYILKQKQLKLASVSPEQQLALLPLAYMNVNDKENKLLKCELRDTHLRNPLIKAMIVLNDEKVYPSTQKNLLNWILEDPKNKKQVVQRSLTIKAIENLNGDVNQIDRKPPAIMLTDLLKEILPDLNAGQNLLELLQKTFFQMRQPLSIFTYAGRLATLPKEERGEALNHLTAFMNAVFSNQFLELRQNPQKNKHLQFFHENYPALFKDFSKRTSKEVNLKQDSTEQKKHMVLRKIIENALQDRHLKDTDLIKFEKHYIPDTEQNFARLRSFPDNTLELEAEIRKKSKEKGEWHKKDLDKFLQLDAYVAYLKLQWLAIRLTHKDVTEAQFHEFCTFFNNALAKNCEFLNDIRSMHALFQNKKVGEKYTLYNTDDPFEILLCGTEVEGSCQRLDGAPNFNRGLLGYLLNGQTRLLTIKEDETILGRAIIRLLITIYDKPVLFLERIYPQTLDPKLKQALIDFAKEIAKELCIPLLNTDIGEYYHFALKNIDAQAPEYIDAVGNICKDYNIFSARSII